MGRRPSRVDDQRGGATTASDRVGWERLCDLFEAAVGLSPHERDRLLLSQEELAPAVRHTVQRMLEAHDRPNAMDAMSREVAALHALVRRLSLGPD